MTRSTPYLYSDEVRRQDCRAAKSQLLDWVEGRWDQISRDIEAKDFFSRRVRKRLKQLSTTKARAEYRDHLLQYLVPRNASLIAHTRRQERSITAADCDAMQSMQKEHLDGFLAYIIFLFDATGSLIAAYNGTGTAKTSAWSRLGMYEVALQWASDGYFHTGLTESQVAAMFEAHKVMVLPFASADRPDRSDELATLKADFQILEGYVDDIIGSLDRRRPPGSQVVLSKGFKLDLDTMLELQYEVAPVYASYIGLNRVSPLAQGHTGQKPRITKLLKRQNGLCALCETTIKGSVYINPLCRKAD